jgi:hypothetical protein
MQSLRPARVWARDLEESQPFCASYEATMAIVQRRVFMMFFLRLHARCQQMRKEKKAGMWD